MSTREGDAAITESTRPLGVLPLGGDPENEQRHPELYDAGLLLRRIAEVQGFPVRAEIRRFEVVAEPQRCGQSLGGLAHGHRHGHCEVGA
jgi:hypothetical protein